MTAKYTIQATTAAEFQTAVVKWLNERATGIRTLGRISERKRIKTAREIEAAAFESAARFISEVVIEQPRAMTEQELLEGLQSNRTCDSV